MLKMKLLSRTALVALCGLALPGSFASAGQSAAELSSQLQPGEVSTIGTHDRSINVEFFYDELSPHGRWVRDRRYNYIFVPVNIDDDWAPYTEGHWAYTRRYGWTWVSDEPFGWATYHYGRWAYETDIGWYWVPGTRWAPAWVSWRRSPTYVGWAPLPPERNGFSVSIQIGVRDVPEDRWFFVPTRDFLDRDLNRVGVRSGDRRRIYQDTELAGPVTVQNNIVINNVIDVNFIERETNRNVVVYNIDESDAPPVAGATATADDGRTLRVFQPQVVEPTAIEAPKTVVEAETVVKERQALRARAGTAGTADPSADAASDGEIRTNAEATDAGSAIPADQQRTEAKPETGAEKRKQDAANAEPDAGTDAAASAEASSTTDNPQNPMNAEAERKAEADANIKAETAPETAAPDKPNLDADAESQAKPAAKMNKAERKLQKTRDAAAAAQQAASEKRKPAEATDTADEVKAGASGETTASGKANANAERAAEPSAKMKKKAERKLKQAPEAAAAQPQPATRTTRKPVDSAKATDKIEAPAAAQRSDDQPAARATAEKHQGKRKKKQQAAEQAMPSEQAAPSPGECSAEDRAAAIC